MSDPRCDHDPTQPCDEYRPREVWCAACRERHRCPCGAFDYEVSPTLIRCRRCDRLWGRVEGRWVFDHESFIQQLEQQLALARRPPPVPLLLFCPHCATQHVDGPQPAKQWNNPPHRSHLCHVCGHVWRPADVPTVGVAAIATRGQDDGSPIPAGLETVRDLTRRLAREQELHASTQALVDVEREERVRLHAAIVEHHGQKADDRCIEDDARLYAAAGLPPADHRVGDKAAMLENCTRFIKRRCEAGGWPTYQELEAALQQYPEVIRRLAAFYSTPEEVHAWLTTPHQLLGDCPACELLADGKVEDVLRVIAQLEDGAYV